MTSDQCPAPRVRIESGELLGLCRAANPQTGIPQYAAFLGVPYAKPPLGELRFKAPRPVEQWPGVREAVRFDQRCIQGSAEAQSGSEDCLHANVYSPWLQRPQNEVLRRCVLKLDPNPNLVNSMREIVPHTTT
ncbi:cholinesterase-like [Thrips palmi]|uniref:Cholinesterase-like n=1 Tax=Thrips palmi TaxID=161013 RepID=A0A6P9AG18_THRPL|nr:cholinesterase-like [Thrips palmi]